MRVSTALLVPNLFLLVAAHPLTVTRIPIVPQQRDADPRIYPTPVPQSAQEPGTNAAEKRTDVGGNRPVDKKREAEPDARNDLESSKYDPSKRDASEPIELDPRDKPPNLGIGGVKRDASEPIQVLKKRDGGTGLMGMGGLGGNKRDAVPPPPGYGSDGPMGMGGVKKREAGGIMGMSGFKRTARLRSEVEQLAKRDADADADARLRNDEEKRDARLGQPDRRDAGMPLEVVPEKRDAGMPLEVVPEKRDARLLFEDKRDNERL